MESGLNLEKVTNGLLTLQRIKQLYNPVQRDENDGGDAGYLHTDRLTLLQDTLAAISDFIPATRGGSFSEAIRHGRHYSSAYRGIKQHLSEMDGARIDITKVLKTMKIIAPVLTNRQKVYMDKVIKIFDVLGS